MRGPDPHPHPDPNPGPNPNLGPDPDLQPYLAADARVEARGEARVEEDHVRRERARLTQYEPPLQPLVRADGLGLGAGVGYGPMA